MQHPTRRRNPRERGQFSYSRTSDTIQILKQSRSEAAPIILRSASLNTHLCYVELLVATCYSCGRALESAGLWNCCDVFLRVWLDGGGLRFFRPPCTRPCGAEQLQKGEGRASPGRNIGPLYAHGGFGVPAWPRHSACRPWLVLCSLGGYKRTYEG